MREVSGLVSEAKPLTQVDPGTEVIRYRKGDVVKVGHHYAVIDGFFRNSQGNRCMRLGVPLNSENARKLQQWGRQNPHRVKVLDAGFHINDSGGQ